MTTTDSEIFDFPDKITGQRLQGKTALITGAGSEGDLLGTGAAMAVLFAAQGANVGIVDVNEARANNTLGLIQNIGGSASIAIADIRDRQACEASVNDIARQFGGIQILVNNAAVAKPGDILSIQDDDWDLMVDVNLKGTMNMTRAASSFLTKTGGAIINISSISAQRGFGAIAYASTKGGIISMTRDMACTLGSQGVRANCLVPGFITTPMVGGTANAGARQKAREATALGTEGSAWDVAWAAVYLASDEARWITAATLNVDGGSDAKLGTTAGARGSQ